MANKWLWLGPLIFATTSSALAYDSHQRQIGTASWYGPGFEGKRTSNGEVYNSQGLTAAHNGLPLGSRVRVTDLASHKSVVVKINDRGSFGRKYHRLIDLSKGAANRLGMQTRGTARVLVSVITLPFSLQKFHWRHSHPRIWR